jgi:hypothetical protein
MWDLTCHFFSILWQQCAPKGSYFHFFPTGIKKILLSYYFIAYHKIVDVNPRGLGANNVGVGKKTLIFYSVWQK